MVCKEHGTEQYDDLIQQIIMPSSHELLGVGIGNAQVLGSTICRSHVQFGGFSRFSQNRCCGVVAKDGFMFYRPGLRDDLG